MKNKRIITKPQFDWLMDIRWDWAVGLTPESDDLDLTQELPEECYD